MSSPTPTPEHTQEETHAWITARVQIGHVPTYAEMSAWSGRAPSTVGRWVKAWVRDGCDPRVSDGGVGEEMGEHTHAPISDDDDTDADLMGEGDVGDDRKRSAQGAIRGLSVPQQRAVELLAGGMRLGEVAREVGVAPDTVSRWLALPKVEAALTRLREESHQAALTLLQQNGQEATRLLLLSMQRVRDLLEKETMDVEDRVRVLNAGARLSKIALEHGGYPKTERIELGGEVGLRGQTFEEESDAELEEEIESLEGELRLIEGGRGESDE